MDWRDRERKGCRRPIGEDEVPFLEALGCDVAATRHALGLSRALVADRAGMHPTSIARIEHGIRRTRLSTLERIAQSIVAADDGPETLHRWVALAGPGLAAESEYAHRVERRRKRRLRSKENRRTAAQAREEELALRDQHAESRTILELAFAIKRSPTRTAEDLDRVLMLLKTMDSLRGNASTRQGGPKPSTA